MCDHAPGEEETPKQSGADLGVNATGDLARKITQRSGADALAKPTARADAAR